MVQNICEVVTEYEKRLQGMPFMLRSSYVRAMLWEDGVKGQWVFGIVERGSGRTFLVPIPDRTTDTLMTIIHARIEPVTTVILDCWGAYRDLDCQGYMHRSVTHSIHFVSPHTGNHTNTIESTWRSIKVFPGQYNRGEDYHYHIAHYIFALRCKAQGILPFLQFLHLVANTNWLMCGVPCSFARAM
jgi:transposase-like protein